MNPECKTSVENVNFFEYCDKLRLQNSKRPIIVAFSLFLGVELLLIINGGPLYYIIALSLYLVIAVFQLIFFQYDTVIITKEEITIGDVTFDMTLGVFEIESFGYGLQHSNILWFLEDSNKYQILLCKNKRNFVRGIKMIQNIVGQEIIKIDEESFS